MAPYENGAHDSYLNIFTTSPAVDANESKKILDLDEQVRRTARSRYKNDCENAVAQLPSEVAEYLLGLFQRVAPSFLPSPLLQSSSFRDETSNSDARIVLRALKIVAAARLALASDEGLEKQEPPLKNKVERIYDAARTYVDSVNDDDDAADLEMSLLLAELEYGRGQVKAAHNRLKFLITNLSEYHPVHRSYLLDHDDKLLQIRSLLQTSILMLYWYFGEMPPPSFTREKMDGQSFVVDQNVSMEDSFASAQIRLACVHAQLEEYIESQPAKDERVWSVCDQAITSCFNTLQAGLQQKEAQNHDSSVTFFVFGQQYLCARIELQSKLELATKRHSGPEDGSDFAQFMTASNMIASDPVRIASGLRSFGQRYRFREAPLSFVRQIQTAAGVIIRMVDADPSGDSDSALINVLTFFCDVLRYMGELHEQARILLETLEHRVNSVLSGPPSRASGSEVGWKGLSVPSRSGTPSKHFTPVRPFSPDSSRGSSRHRNQNHNSRPQSSAGILAKSNSRPKLPRSTSTPNEVPSHNPRPKKESGASGALLSPSFTPKHKSAQMDPPIDWEKKLETLKL